MKKQKKQLITIAALASVFVLLLVGYLVILMPILNRPAASDTAAYLPVSGSAEGGTLYFVAGTYTEAENGSAGEELYVLDPETYLFREAGEADAGLRRYRKTSDDGFTRVSPIPAGTALGEGHFLYGSFSPLSGTSNGTLRTYTVTRDGVFAAAGQRPAGESLDGHYAFRAGAATVDDTEVLEADGRYLLFPQIVRDQIQSISVTNREGTYRIVRDVDDKLEIDRFAGVPYDAIKMSALISAVGYPSTADRICIYATDEQMKEYGLDHPIASFTVTDLYGTSRTVEIGDALLANSGYYYCRLVGRDAVYTMSVTRTIIAPDYSSVSSIDLLLQPVEYLVSPALVEDLTVNNYFMVDNLMLLDQNGQRLFVITNQIGDRSDTSSSDGTAAGVADSMTELAFYPPSPYQVDSTLVWNTIYAFASGDLRAMDCFKLEGQKEDFIACGLQDPYRTFYFEVLSEDGKDAEGNVKYKTEERIFLYFSERQDDDTYYCASSLYPGVITRVDADSFSFVEKPFLSWVSEMVFPEDIKTIESIRVEGFDRNLGRQDVTFTLHHSVEKEPYRDSDGTLKYRYTYLLDVDTDAGISFPNAEVLNFRRFYMTLLGVSVKGEAGLSPEETEAVLSDPSNLLLRFTYTKTSGASFTLEFRTYTSSGRRVLICTQNGGAELYAAVDDVTEVLVSLGQLMRGEEVNPDLPG